MRSHPAKYGEGFDAPPTLERSGSERRGGAVTSLALLERARAWEWIKDPPAGVSVPYKGNRRGRKDLKKNEMSSFCYLQ